MKTWQNRILYLAAMSMMLVATSCSEPAATETGSTVIVGELRGVQPGQTIALELVDGTTTVVDSFRFDEASEFHLSTSPEKPGYYRLSLADNNFLILALHDEDSVRVSANALRLGTTYQVTGSAESARLKRVNKYLTIMDSLNRVLQFAMQNNDLQQRIQVSAYGQQIGPQARAEFKAVIQEKPGSLASLSALGGLDPDQDFEDYRAVQEGLSTVIPDSPYYKSLKAKVDELKKLAIGAEAPEIMLNDRDGQSLALSSLKGKVVLLDFWASWCKPCRAENPNVVRLYEQYRNQGFEVFSVSLDVDRGKWLGAIQVDRLTWDSHVSDLRGWKTSVGPLYNIKSIPQTYLLDRDGKIIAKNLRGPALGAKLSELFGA